MSIPAVPDYVIGAAGDFTDCPPGHRFNLYFPIWTPDWELAKNDKTAALRQVLKLGNAKKALTALLQRQKALADALPEGGRFIVEARSTAPFATGLGLEHPIENGFAFLSPYGLPYLAGSGVKGVLRRAGEELEQEGELPRGTVLALFGPDTEEIKRPEDARHGALTCWDIFPVPPKDELAVEIMTPHYSDYYQNRGTPNDAGKPNPIPFLAVPAGSKFRFVVTCEPALLSDAMPENEWMTALERIFVRAFDWLGFGAKTAVGYGAMEEDPEAKAEREKREAVARAEALHRAEEARRATLSPEDRAWEEHEAQITVFRQQFDSARARPYQRGGLFDNQRVEFMRLALAWEDSRSRRAAGELLRETMGKNWGTPGKKESKQRLKDAIEQLMGQA